MEILCVYVPVFRCYILWSLKEALFVVGTTQELVNYWHSDKNQRAGLSLLMWPVSLTFLGCDNIETKQSQTQIKYGEEKQR